ncbi:MAG: ABC transporter permease [Bacilli bacterium]|nr:ABC transporter permease [Bacilli bacterium]
MWKYVLKRVVLIFITTFIILSLTYILLQFMPVVSPRGQVAAQLAYWDEQVRLGYYLKVNAGVAAQYAEKIVIVDTNDPNRTTYYYVAVPALIRYFNWLKNIFTEWNWGTSTAIVVGKSAMEIEAMRLPVSMRLNVISIIISVPAGLSLGILAALKKNTWIDSLISTVIMVFISIPSFVLISFMLIWFSYQTGWLPTFWPSEAMAAAYPVRAFKAYIIPVASLCFGSIASFTRYTRAELTEVMSSEFLLLARTKGLTKSQTIVRHAMRNSMVPIVPMIISEFIGILSGSMVLEQLYQIPGVGSLFVSALNSQDYGVLMADMAVYTLIGLAATLVVDLSYGIVDPRIRMGASK